MVVLSLVQEVSWSSSPISVRTACRRYGHEDRLFRAETTDLCAVPRIYYRILLYLVFWNSSQLGQEWKQQPLARTGPTTWWSCGNAAKNWWMRSTDWTRRSMTSSRTATGALTWQGLGVSVSLRSQTWWGDYPWFHSMFQVFSTEPAQVQWRQRLMFGRSNCCVSMAQR